MDNSQSFHPLQNYQIIKELARHEEEIYINYLAYDQITNQSVILTKFTFPQLLKNTQPNIDYHKILTTLQTLDHQGIPQHLNCFEWENGFCLIQEYPQTNPLTSTKEYTLEEIKKITISALEIITYLQQQNLAIFHHQISPHNLLIDDNCQVYLINFGFAQMGDLNFPLYPIINQSKGLIPPEKKRGKKLTNNSDLYSLGGTLLSLITGIEPIKINSLMNKDSTLNLSSLVSNQISLIWLESLEKMIAINPQFRYQDALTALNSFKDLEINRLPDVKINPDYLELKANDYGEIITQTVTITNPIPDTNLQGKWEVIASPYDGNITTSHPWISFKPVKFSANKINCQIIIDTGKLKLGKTYQRQLIIKANSTQQNHLLPLKIETAIIKAKNYFSLSLIMVLIVALGGGWLSGFMVNTTPDLVNWMAFIFGLLIGIFGGYGASFSKLDWFIKSVGMITSLEIIVGLVGLGTDLDLLIGFVVSLIVSCGAGMMIKFYPQQQCPRKIAIILACLTACFGMSFGLDLSFIHGNSFFLILALITGFPLIWLLLKPYWQYQKRLNLYRQKERSLIQS